MKGQILGFDGTSGAISAEDGNRYNFTKDQWRDERPPAPRDQVDFVASGNQAQEIYRVKAGLSVNLPNAGAVDTEKVQAARGYIALRPQLILAAVVLLSGLFLNFMSNGGSGDECCVKLTSVHTIYGGIGTALDAQAETERQVGGLLGGLGSGGSIEQQIAQRQQENSAGGNIRTIISVLNWLSYALWLIPLGAALIVYREIKNDRHRGLELLVGLGCLLSLLSLPLMKFMFSKAGGIVGYALNMGAGLMGYSFGAFVIGLAGLGLIGTGLGRINRTPGL